MLKYIPIWTLHVGNTRVLLPQSLVCMYWSCPSLAMFWTSVFNITSEPFNHHIEPYPMIAIFAIVPDLDLPKAKVRMLALATLFAQRDFFYFYKIWSSF